MSIFKEVFEKPNEYKHDLYPGEILKTCKMFSSTLKYESDKVHLWRESLRHPAYPLEQWQHLWPEYPTTYR